MDIGARISFLRTQKNYTVNKLANMSGISQSYLRDVELGKKNPTVEILSFVCDALDISLSDFFDDGTLKKITTDPLLNTIYQSNSEQRETLNAFLNALLK